MKVVLVGGAGFIGSHLARELVDAGHYVTVLDPASPLIRTEGVDYVVGDAPTYLVAAAPPSDVGEVVIVHLAAAVGRVFGEDDPASTIASNAALTADVARHARIVGARLVYTSTSEVYGDLGLTRSGREDDPSAWRLPHNLYGLSKRWGEEAATLYALGAARREGADELPISGLTIVRPSMPYGPGLPAGRGRAAIVNMIAQAEQRRRIVTHAGAERSWCWIGDAVAGFRAIIERGQTALSVEDVAAGWGCYNLGRDDAAVPMEYVARYACLLAGLDQDAAAGLIDLVAAPSNQTVVKRLSTSKLRNLGWKPSVPLEEGMRLTRDWMLANGQA